MLGQVAQRLLVDSTSLETFRTRLDGALNNQRMSLLTAFKGHLAQSKLFCGFSLGEQVMFSH